MDELFPAAALLVAAAIWGVTFPLVKDALLDIGAFEFLAIRFTIATLVLAAIFPRAAKDALFKNRRAGLIVGALLALGHAFQTIGLHLTRSTNAGFITGLYVVFTPLIAAIVFRKRPPTIVLAGVAVTTAGLALLSLRLTGSHVSVNEGDLLVLACAVVYGAEIVALGWFAPDLDPRAFTIQQLGVTAVAFMVLTPFQHVRAPTSRAVWIGLLSTAIGSSVFGISVQTWAQQRVSPTRTAVIASSEAVFAALAAFVLANEHLPGRAWIGAALILLGILVVELRPQRALREA